MGTYHRAEFPILRTAASSIPVRCGEGSGTEVIEVVVRYEDYV
jgi:hypothetical protein